MDHLSDIVITDLSKSYPSRRDGTGEKKAVLSHLSLTVPAGKKTCLMGESGCGKTTLLRILLGLETADSGQITGLPEKISAVFQEDRLCEDFSVLTNLLLPFDFKTRKEKEKKTEEALRLLSGMGLSGEEHKKAALLSGGMKRRVSLIRALLYDGDLLLLDEPFKGLDEKNRDDVAAILRSYDKTVLMVTHDPLDAARLDAGIIGLSDHFRIRNEFL